MPKPPIPPPGRSPLFTDLYQLTMAQAYLGEQMDEPAVFELFFRELPAGRDYAVAAGLDDALDFLGHARFSEAELDYLREQEQPEGHRLFGDAFLEALRDFRFAGEVWAVPEGTVVLPHEPVMQVIAPIAQAQLVETLLLNQVHFQSVSATKAARVMRAARGRTVVDFGSRRAHGTDAALKTARCAFLAGAAGTSNVLAGMRYGIPVFGTMAHSYIQAHGDEATAFEAFARRYPQTTLLVDTYDTLEGVERVIELARRLGDRFDVRALRLDSGDLAELAKQARRLLDDAGLGGVKLFASSGLDEHKIAALLDAGAPIDGFGVGTKLAVSADAPDLDFAYKLVAYADQPRTKLSSSKVIYPGRKQVRRRIEGGRWVGDVLGGFDEQLPGEPLLCCVMRGGRRTEEARDATDLHRSRKRCAEQLGLLPPPADAPAISDGVAEALDRLRRSAAGPAEPAGRGA